MEVEQSPDNVVPLNHDDPLRQGLLLLCRQLGRPLGDAELVDGLALEHGRLPLRLVVRALRRADITAKVAELPLRQMDAYLLPALLLLDDGRSLLLVGVEGEQYEVLVPQSEGGRDFRIGAPEPLEWPEEPVFRQAAGVVAHPPICLLYTSPSPRD